MTTTTNTLDHDAEQILAVILTYGVDRHFQLAPKIRASPFSANGVQLDEEAFRRHLLVEDQVVSARLASTLSAQNAPIRVSGRPGCGKTTTIHSVLSRHENAGGHVLHIDLLREGEDILESGSDAPDFNSPGKDDDESSILNVGSLAAHKAKASQRLYDTLTKRLYAQARSYACKLYSPNDQNSLIPAILELFRYHSSLAPGKKPTIALSTLLQGPYLALRDLYDISQYGVMPKSSFADWLDSSLGQSRSPEVVQLMTDALRAAQCRDLLSAIQLSASVIGQDATKTVVWLDNADAVLEPYLIETAYMWFRDYAQRMLGCAQFLITMRTESVQLLGTGRLLDFGSVFLDAIDFEELHAAAASSLGTPNSEGSDSRSGIFNAYRRQMEQQVITKRLAFMEAKLSPEIKAHTPFTERFALLQMYKNHPYISGDANALANCSHRNATLALFNFSKVAQRTFPFASQLGAGHSITDEEREKINLHLESLYYSWIANGLKEYPCSFGTDKYAPGKAAASSRHDQQYVVGTVIQKKFDHLLLASIYNAANVAARRPQLVQLAEILPQLRELGVDDSVIATTIIQLMADRPERTRDRSASSPLRTSTPPQFKDGVPLDAFLRRQYIIPGDHYHQSQPVGQWALPNRLMLSDRAVQLLEVIGVKFHYVLGTHQLAPWNASHLKRINDINVCPVDDAFLLEAYTKFQELALFHARGLYDIGHVLRPIYSEAWLDIARSRFGLPAVSGVGAFGVGNSFLIDRMARSASLYLERLARTFAVESKTTGSKAVPGQRIGLGEWARRFQHLSEQWTALAKGPIASMKWNPSAPESFFTKRETA